jgi:dephospho-CoA kinase
MTDTPTVIEVDCTTGVQTERPMTADEIADMEKAAADHAARQAEEEAAAKAKADALASAQAKLAKLGLTADEVAALL